MTASGSPDVRVREAGPGDLAAVLGVLDGAALSTDAATVRERTERGDALVAVADAGNGAERRSDRAGEERAGDGDRAGTVVGALVLDGTEITHVAVRRRRRGQGVGTALVAAAADRHEGLVAEFDDGARPFYEALGFEIEAVGDGRYRGRLAGELYGDETG